jgi:hypothetical protein
MLPERITELLSAYVDGELSSRERRSVTRILRKSAEARQMLHKLKKDSMILRKLPRKKTQIDLSQSAMGTISLRGIKLPKVESVPQPPPGAARTRPFWIRTAVAGVVLLAVLAASYLMFSLVFRRNADPDTSQLPAPTAPKHHPALRVDDDQPDRPPPPLAVVHEPENSGSPPAGTNPPKDDRFDLGAVRLPALTPAQPRLLLILGMQELQGHGGNLLLRELKKGAATRIDLFCTTDTVPAVELLQTVCRASSIDLRLDAYAQARVKQKARTNFVAYCEELTPEEWVALLQQLAREEQKAAGVRLDKVTVNPLTPTEMARILGGEASLYERRDVSASTGQQVAQALAGKKRTDPDDLNPDRAMLRHAVVVPYLPQPGFSREVRYLVERPDRWRLGAIQVLLVLWNR